MLTTAQIGTHLNRRIYMPGWEFYVYDGIHEGQHLVIKAVLPDAYSPGDAVTVQIENMLPPIPNVEYLDRWMVWRLSRIASHEVREFWRDTTHKPIFDPHAEFAERDLEA